MEEKVIQLKDLQPGSSYLVRARAINKYGVVSEWSETYTLNIVKDDLKPSVPASPTVNLAGPQKVVVIHDNKKKVGGDLEFDVVAYKVFTNTTQSNVGGTLIHTMAATRPGSGIDSFATINVNAPLVGENGATVYFYVTAVDSAGNESDPSDATTGKAITYFDSAYISDLTADRIRTGTLQANQQISVGTTAPIIIKSNATSPRGQIYIGTTTNPTGAVGSGYRDTQTAFYVDSTGKFSLKDQLYWDGTTLTIQGVLKVGEAEGDITTISGDKVRTGNLISNNYISNIPGQPQAQSNSFTNAGTWIDLDSGAIYSKGFYITGTGDVDPEGNPIAAGTAVFGGEVFGARGIFSDYITKVSGQDLTSSEGLRYPTLVVESTNTNDGYLVLFKNTGTKSGVEFYVKQGSGDGTGETQQVNWRRGSLAHLAGGDWPGGVLRLASYKSSTGKTPGLMHIYAETGETEPGEIHLDADRVYISKFWVKENFANDSLSNFWKDPDIVTNGSRFFQVGNMDGSGIEVKKDSNGLPKVSILNYEIVGVAKIVDNSRITIKNVSDTIDLIKIGKNVDGTRDGIFINSNNYWTLNNDSSNVRFRIGDTSGSFIYWDGSTLSIKGNITVTGGDAATKTYADTVAANAAASISVLQKLGTEVTGAVVTSLGEIYSAGKSSYSSTTNGWYLGWIDPTTVPASSRTPAFNIGNNTNYLKWTGSSLEVSGTIISGSTMPGGSFSGGTAYGSGVSFAGNKVFISDQYGGIITFSDGASTAFGSIGSATASGKFSGFEAGSKAIMIGQAGYPQIEIGKDSVNANKILMYTGSTVGIEIRPSNVIIRGGTSSRIRGIGTTDSVPAGKRILYGNDVSSSSDDLVWGPVPGGGGGSSVPAGTITMYGGSSAPSGWLLCNGQAVSRSIFSDLFSAIGTSYGAGNGSTTFNVPDFISGGPGGTPAFPRGGSTPGNTGGQASFTLTVDNIPQHSHGNGSLAVGGSLGGSGAFSHSGTMDEKGGHTHSSLSATNSTQTSHDHGVGTYAISGSTGSGGAHSHTYTTYSFGTASNTANTGTANRLTGATASSTNTGNEPSHTHGAGTLAISGSSGLAGNHTHTITFDWTNAAAGSHRHNVTIDDHASHTHSITGLTVTGTTGNWGTLSPTSINNQPPFIVVNFIIKT